METLTALKDSVLDRTFGSGEYHKVEFKMNDKTVEKQTLMSARQIRFNRIIRFGGYTLGGFTLVHMLSNLAGWEWDRYDSTSEFILGLLVIANFFAWGFVAQRKLRNEETARANCQRFAHFVDDFAEDNAEQLTEWQRTHLRCTAIDFMEHSLDPTKYDQPWWRLRQLDNR
jgi:hypothetical protein